MSALTNVLTRFETVNRKLAQVLVNLIFNPYNEYESSYSDGQNYVQHLLKY